ncbi:hypothetical protein FBEOM_11361 [Fusarium beomiforme]|uniref:Uncharacterized protein n=1 Tax=Fusarium beomiforme TaxID=44412 RepID=A0A9P5A9Q5_9HYPO|nr:hypothetical protein FBEOM_11361 [Fusarium beomiforme]
MSPRPDTQQFQTPERRDALYTIRKMRQQLEATDTTEDDYIIDRDIARPQGLFYNRDEILHQLRGVKEKKHQENMYILFARLPLHWNLPVIKDDPDWDLKHLDYGLEHLVYCRNKSVAIFLFDAASEGADLHIVGVLYSIDVWLYHQWFKPYESDIEHGHYIAKSIPLGLELGATDLTLAIISHFHQKLVHSLSPSSLRDILSGKLQNLSASSPPPSEQVDKENEHFLPPWANTML